ncbi:MAG: hypothetical protein LQ338_006924 [Usnochroma carphineum]|nr:MAG: hypothetical protein LQ338_006924 [Usnochroma carphineum]
MNLLMLNIVEQMVGIIVACMPVFPSLFRHYSEKRSRSGPVTPTSKEFMNSFIARRQQQKPASTLSGKNPYSVHGQYKELGDLEGQRQEGPGGRSAAVEMVPVGSLE